MNIIKNPAKAEWAQLQRRCQSDQADISALVSQIVAEVRDGGDAALKRICQRVGDALPEGLKVSAETIAEASEKLSPELKEALGEAYRNIYKFHKAQMPAKVEVEVGAGIVCSQRAVPLHRVGLYIPGGKAPLFSTVLMLAIPAMIAGCQDVVMCTPCGKDGSVNPAILYAASLCGIKSVFAIGGAQAIAAMAYGTETVPRVDKIFGPGNRFVTTAKQIVAIDGVAIDMPAGPSEVMIMADESALPSYVAADMLSQCEHGSDSQAMLLCASSELAEKVKTSLEEQLKALDRKAIAEDALKNSRIIVFEGADSRQKMTDFANEYASEHLIISMQNPWEIADKIYAAGSIFIGNFSPESAGDYASGTNHTLPTNGCARSYSGVNIDSFMRKITYQCLSQEGLKSLSQTIITMAKAEGLGAHAAAVEVRMKGGNS